MRITIEIPKDCILDSLQVGSVVHAVGTIVANQRVLMDQTRRMPLVNGCFVEWSTEVDAPK